MKKYWLASGVIAAGLSLASPFAAAAQSTGSAVTEGSSAGTVSPELLTSTVHEAWVASGRNEDKFFDMVKQLAALSAQKREVALPDTEATGRKIGLLIKQNARRDPDQLLYAVVDLAVKQTAAASKAAAAAK